MTRQTILTIQSGLHRGARADIPKGSEITLGRDAGCEIVLSDAAVADEHLSLRMEGRKLVLTSIGGAVEVPGQGRVEPGFRTRLSRSTDMRFGDVTLRAEIPSGIGRRVPAGAGAIAVASFLLFGSMIVVRTPPTAEAAATPDLSVQSEPAVVVVPRAEPSKAEAAAHIPEDRAAVAAEIEARLSSYGFGNIRLETGRETFTLSGRIPADQRNIFGQFQEWFDAAHPSLVLRTSAITFTKDSIETRPPAIESVWTMGEPYIVIAGRRYYGGDRVPNGWRLERIEEERAIFSDGAETYRVALGASDKGDGSAIAAQVAAR